jgi:hypothetical protein
MQPSVELLESLDSLDSLDSSNAEDVGLWFRSGSGSGFSRLKHIVCIVPRLIRAYVARLIRFFSWRFLAFLFFSQFLIKGTLHRLSMGAMLPLFKGMGIDAVQFQLYMTMAMVPWSIKPIVGLLSDLVVLGGYHKRYWIVQSIFFGSLACMALYIVYGSALGTGILVLCFVGIQYEVSTMDLLSEGKYAECMREHPESGSDIITLVNGYQMAGAIAAMSIVGYMADAQLWYVLFTLFLLLSITPLVPTLLGWLPEEKRTPETDVALKRVRFTRGWVAVDKARFYAQARVILVVGFTGLAGPIMVVIAVYGSPLAGVIVAAIMMVGALMGSKIAFPSMVTRVALYQTIAYISKPSIGGALDYFYTADETCLPGGPAFSFKYYLTYTGLVGASVSFAGVWIYQAWLSKWRFRSVLIFTTVLVGCGGMMDLFIVTRTNVALGINDHVAYIAGEAVLESVILMLYWIPSSALLSKVVPPGMESSSYAFLAGLANFSSMFSDLTGVLIYSAAGIKTTTATTATGTSAGAGACDFESLWWLVIVFHVMLPVIIGVPATLLIPNCKQTDQLDGDGNVQDDTILNEEGEEEEEDDFEFIELDTLT